MAAVATPPLPVGGTPEMPVAAETLATPATQPPEQKVASRNLEIIKEAEQEAGGKLAAGDARPVLEQTAAPEGESTTAGPAGEESSPSLGSAEGDIAVAPAAEATQPKDEQTRVLLTDLGKLLLKVRDARALVIGQALASGDTPLARQYRDVTLRSFAKDLPDVKQPDLKPVLADIQSRSGAMLSAPEPDFATSPMADFLRRHGQAGLVDQFAKLGTSATAEQMNILLEQATNKKPDSLAASFRSEVFGDTEPPRNTNDLVKAFGVTGTDAAKLKSDLNWTSAKDNVMTAREAMKKKINAKSPSGPAVFMGIVMSIQMMSQFMSEAEGGGRGGGGH